MGKPRRQFSEETKRQAVDDFVSGRRSAAEISAELGVAQGVIYRWRVQLEEQARGLRVGELEAEGRHPEDAKRIQRLEEELAEYKRKLGEQTLINDLLKKLRNLPISQRESELSGLIDTFKSSARRRGGVR
jgi:transposase-like protein